MVSAEVRMSVEKFTGSLLREHDGDLNKVVVDLDVHRRRCELERMFVSAKAFQDQMEKIWEQLGISVDEVIRKASYGRFAQT